MKYQTKQKRLIALTEVWQQLHGQSTFTTAEVAAWAKANGLYPVARRIQGPVACQAWEDRLAKVIESAKEIEDETGRLATGPTAGPDVEDGCGPDAQEQGPVTPTPCPDGSPCAAGPDDGGGDGDQAEG